MKPTKHRTPEGLKVRNGYFYTYYRPGGPGTRLREVTTKCSYPGKVREALEFLARDRALLRLEVEEGRWSTRPTSDMTPDDGVDLMAEMEAWDVKRARETQNRGRFLHAGSIRQIEYCWRNLRKHIRSVRQVTRVGLRQFVLDRQGDVSARTEGKPPSNKTIRQDLQVLKRALTEFEALGRRVPVLRGRDWPILRHDENDKCDKTTGRVMQRSDVQAQLQGFEGGRSEAEHRALFVVHLLTGLRKDEIAMLVQRPHCAFRSDAHGGMMVVDTKKIAVRNEPPRQIPLTPDALDALRLLMSVPRIKDHKSAFRAAAKRAGLFRSAHLRDLRHTFITTCNTVASGANVGRYLAGHRRPKNDTHLTYDHPTPYSCVKAVRRVAEVFGLRTGDKVTCPEHPLEPV